MRWSLVILRLCVLAPMCCSGGITGSDGTASASSQQQDATPFLPSTFDDSSRRMCVARTTVCAITDDGLACWGTEPPEHLRSDRSLFAVSCGLFHTCVLHADERTKEHGATAHAPKGGDEHGDERNQSGGAMPQRNQSGGAMPHKEHGAVAHRVECFGVDLFQQVPARID